MRLRAKFLVYFVIGVLALTQTPISRIFGFKILTRRLQALHSVPYLASSARQMSSDISPSPKKKGRLGWHENGLYIKLIGRKLGALESASSSAFAPFSTSYRHPMSGRNDAFFPAFSPHGHAFRGGFIISRPDRPILWFRGGTFQETRGPAAVVLES